jgi:hypothetical protein
MYTGFGWDMVLRSLVEGTRDDREFIKIHFLRLSERERMSCLPHVVAKSLTWGNFSKNQIESQR